MLELSLRLRSMYKHQVVQEKDVFRRLMSMFCITEIRIGEVEFTECLLAPESPFLCFCSCSFHFLCVEAEGIGSRRKAKISEGTHEYKYASVPSSCHPSRSSSLLLVPQTSVYKETSGPLMGLHHALATSLWSLMCSHAASINDRLYMSARFPTVGKHTINTSGFLKRRHLRIHAQPSLF